MIKVDRTQVPVPRVLSMDGDSPARIEREKAEVFFRKGQHDRQVRFPFKVYKYPEIKDALVKLFNGKCAYCESRYLSVAPVDIELFRPKAGVSESPSHPGYWWLAMVWENMLPSCAVCNRLRSDEGIKTGKANRFPLEDEAMRAFDPGQELLERPLLLDPCVDNPEDHLVFDKNGMVMSDTARGQAAIAILGLNRRGLVDARRLAAQGVLEELALLERFSGESDIPPEVQDRLDSIYKMMNPEEEYSAMKRQLILPVIRKLDSSPATKQESILMDIAATARPISRARKRHIKAAFSAFEHDQSLYSLEDAEGREKYRFQRRLIERISIKNIKAIQALELDLTSKSGRTSWLMLLGENGTGKSTALQATAITLLGAKSFIELAERTELHPRDFVRYGCKTGTISVKLSGFHKPHKLIFMKDRVEFTGPAGDKTEVVFDESKIRVDGAGWDPQTLLLGYGATRLLPRKSAGLPSPESQKAFSRVDNLFDSFVPLLNAERWLLNFEAARFDNVAIIIKDLLALGSSAKLLQDHENEQIVVVDHKARVPLRRLSDGYQSMVALAIDILEIALRLWPNLQEAEGIILLDELGAHLHPTWKMRVVESLRRALPAMQFLVTTHDPLCLRGLGLGEVAVMRRDENSRIVVLSELPSPADLRVDQLLTSDFFGLNSTVDPEVEKIFDEYYALMALQEPTETQKARLENLREELKDRRYLGSTPRENLMYDAIDKLVANRKLTPNIPVVEIQQKAVDAVADIWKRSVNVVEAEQ
jgi:hypothetical protein